MAADVSRLQMKSDSRSSALITRDFLGGGGGDSKELDLDLHVPIGWEKRLDLQSGKVYIQRCTPTASSSHQKIKFANQPSPTQTNVNYATISRPTLNLFVDTSLELKPVSPSSSNGYQSVCTLDKVKLALDRAKKESSNKKRPSPSMSSISNSSSLSAKEREDDDAMLPSKFSSSSSTLMPEQCNLMVAAACPGCLLYVLIPKDNPKCPRCSSVIQMPVMPTKKPRIDLNISI
ncbi:hypothetical protein AKJ16_DCAP19335 [Drosera capensis]